MSPQCNPAPQLEARWEELAKELVSGLLRIMRNGAWPMGSLFSESASKVVAEAFVQVAAEAREADRAELEALRRFYRAYCSYDKLSRPRILELNESLAAMKALMSPSKGPK